jgi:hypothetical protein
MKPKIQTPLTKENMKLKVQFPFLLATPFAFTAQCISRFFYTSIYDTNVIFMKSMFISISNSAFLDTLFSFNKKLGIREEESVRDRKTKTSAQPPRFFSLTPTKRSKYHMNTNIPQCEIYFASRFLGGAV